MKYSLKKKIIGGISLSTALFVFQACYGTPQDFTDEVVIEGQVVSKSTGNPIPGIRVSSGDLTDVTNFDGRFWFYARQDSSYTLRFEDVDSVENNEYKSYDTIVFGQENRPSLTIELEDK